jgi:sugar phosphate isomerase/epimerase
MKLSFILVDPVADASQLAERMRQLSDLGYQGIELSATFPPRCDLDKVAALAEKYHLPVVSLLSGWSYANEGLCLCSPDAGVRDRAVQRLRDYARQAARLGAVVVVGLMQGLRSDEPDEARANERIVDCFRRVAAGAAEAGVTVVIEPVNHLQVGFNHTAAAVAALVNQVSSPALGYMLDTIHMNIEERSILDTVRAHGQHIRHFHLCETNGAPFGTGNLDFPAVLAALRESGYDHHLSVKIYQQVAWEDAARSAATFLARLPDAPKR